MDCTSYAIRTPLGSALCVLDADSAIRELKLGEGLVDAADPAASPAAAEVQRQLDEYFDRKRKAFELLLAPQGTGFQLAVWRELTRLPYGSTVSYGELAERLGKPDAVRAVGRANGANPVWVVIPCHRVVGARGSLTGYAGGLEVKRKLLELEGALQPDLFSR